MIPEDIITIKEIPLSKDGGATGPRRFLVRVMGESLGTAQFERKYAKRDVLLIRKAIETAIQAVLAHGFAGCPSEDVVAQMRERAARCTERFQVLSNPDEIRGLLAVIDWQRSVVAVLSKSPEGDDFKRLLEAARQEGRRSSPALELLRRARRELQRHNEEYRHVTGKELLGRIDELLGEDYS